MIRYRIVNQEIIELYTKHYNKSSRPLVLIYEAPTGYGKSRTSPLIGKNTIDNGVSAGYIHVLPMRSIVYDLYTSLRHGSGPLKTLNASPDEVSYQASGLGLLGKNPYHSAKYNITTIDSFLYNLIKKGVGRDPSTYHYEAARAMIFTSINVFDEAHLYGGDPGNPSHNLFSSLLLAIRSSIISGSPTMILTATLPAILTSSLIQYIRRFISSVKGSLAWIEYGYGSKIYSDGVVKENTLKYTDEEYDELIRSVSYETTIYNNASLGQISGQIIQDLERGYRVLVVLNKPSRAVEIYRRLKDRVDHEPLLIHGRLKYSDRIRSEEKIKETEILVATQVVEAGIDQSFDIIYTDIAPITNLIQRIGRVNRFYENEKGFIKIINDEGAYSMIYDENIIRRTLTNIKELMVRHGKYSINWRSVIDYDGVKGYKTLMDKIYQGYRPATPGRNFYELLQIASRPEYSGRDAKCYMYNECKKGKGIVRDTLLVPVIPVDDPDKLDPGELEEHVVPVGLDHLMHHLNKIQGPVKIYYSSGDTAELKNKSQHSLRAELCYEMTYGGRKGKYFLGVVVPSTSYVEGVGLWV